MPVMGDLRGGEVFGGGWVVSERLAISFLRPSLKRKAVIYPVYMRFVNSGDYLREFRGFTRLT